MLIYVKKKLFTDRRTDGRTTQNYSSEPHKKIMLKKNLTANKTNIWKKVGRLDLIEPE